MIDIIAELSHYPVTIQVYDPVLIAADVRNEYQLELTEYEHLKKADAVIYAVPHDEFCQSWLGAHF